MNKEPDSEIVENNENYFPQKVDSCHFRNISFFERDTLIDL